MAETLVLCGGAEGRTTGAKGTLRLNLSGSNANISLRIDDISRRLIITVPPVLWDLLEIATYVYCADQLVSRGGSAMRSLGADWRRDFHFLVHVREPDRWNAPEVKACLEQLLGFMSDDHFRFSFVPAEAPASIESYFDFSDDEGSIRPASRIVLFSGGLDSLAGAVEALRQPDADLLLVSHQSSTKVAHYQRELAGGLKARFPNRLLHIPVRVSLKGMRAKETTQRSRTFLYAAVAAAVAHLTNAEGLCFYENGVVSFNLPIAAQVVGAHATRSTHPRVLHDMQVFLSALFGHRMQVENPYIWKTKSDVVSILRDAGHADLVRFSVSCSHTYGMTRLHTHCGRCSQCLDRRFGTLAAGLSAEDPGEMYHTDLLTGVRETGDERTMAVSYVRHAQELCRMSDIAFAGRFTGHIARSLSGFPDLTAEEVMRRALDLHRRHGDTVVSVLDCGFSQHAHRLATGVLADSCLLRLVGGASSVSSTNVLRDPAEIPSAEAQADDPRDFRQTSEVRLALDKQNRAILVQGIPQIRRPSAYAVIDILVQTSQEDRAKGLLPENYRYVRAREIVKKLDVKEQTLRRRVHRVRRTIHDRYQDQFGLTLASDALIESKPWKGYRINPAVRIVAADQIVQPAMCHDSGKGMSRQPTPHQ